MFTTGTFPEVIQTVKRQDKDTWRPLRLLNYYRIILACTFLGLFLLGASPSQLGQYSPRLYFLFSLLYLVFGIIGIFSIEKRIPRFTLQLLAQVTIDIVFLTVLIHSSGGLTSGLGILLVISVACSSLLASDRQAIFIASIASLAILFQTVYADLSSDFIKTTYTHAGLLGIAFFVTSVISLVLSRRLKESEALVIQRELDLANLEQLNDYIIQNLQSGIIVIDGQNRIRLVNEAARDLLHINDRKKPKILANLSAELFVQLDQWLYHTDYSPKPFKPESGHTDVLPRFARLGKGENNGTVIFLDDATEMSQQLQQMKLAALGRLTASIAHEIRNPLGAISHAAQLLDESPHLQPEDHRLTEIIHTHSRRMNAVIQNVLQLSRRENTRPEKIRLQEWLERFRAEYCSIENIDCEQIEVDIDPEDMIVSFDSTHLHQIIWNLCQNAAQHGHSENDSGPVHIRLYGRNTTDERGFYLDVIDNGSGIDPESVQHIFEPFFTTAAKGTGLGLYITRELCECNNARLGYLPAEDGGACFRLSFPDPARVRL